MTPVRRSLIPNAHLHAPTEKQVKDEEKQEGESYPMSRYLPYPYLTYDLAYIVLS